MPWIFNEDAALKQRLLGLTVADVNAPKKGRPVAVRFRLPETDLADLTYPSLIIDHASVLRDAEREHRGRIRLPYAPEGKPLWDTSDDPATSPYLADFPIPYNLDYQVTLICRKAQHHIALVAALAAQDRIPARFGALDIPADGTVRRLDLIGGPDLSTTKDSDGKRLFTATYLVRVSTELPPEVIDTASRVLEVDGVIADRDTGHELDHWLATYDDALIPDPDPQTP